MKPSSEKSIEVTTKKALLKALHNVGVLVDTKTVLNWQKANLFLKPKRQGKNMIYPRPLPELLTWANYLYSITDSRFINYQHLDDVLKRHAELLGKPNEVEKIGDYILNKSLPKEAEAIKKSVETITNYAEALLVAGFHGFFFNPQESPRRLDSIQELTDKLDLSQKEFKKIFNILAALGDYMTSVAKIEGLQFDTDGNIVKKGKVLKAKLEN